VSQRFSKRVRRLCDCPRTRRSQHRRKASGSSSRDQQKTSVFDTFSIGYRYIIAQRWDTTALKGKEP
jgi:hypothetical protein